MSTAAIDHTDRQGMPLAGLMGILAASAGALYASGEFPHLPSKLPSLLELKVTLQSSDAPLAAFGYVFSTLAWLVWAWIAGTLLLQVALLALERLPHVGAEAAALRHVVGRFTLPVVRRSAEAAFGALLMASVAVQSAPAAMAASPWAVVSLAAVHSSNQAVIHPAPNPQPAREIEYIVQHGDNLWAISQRFYGTGTEFQRIVDANIGRKMPDSGVFTNKGQIYAGWVLRIPLPSEAIQQESGHTYYVAEAGDTLSGIAARFLGDENRYQEIFDLNAVKARLDDGRTLSDPRLIWPGLRLELPLSQPAQPPVESPPPPAPPAEQVAGISTTATETATLEASPTPAETAVEQPTSIVLVPSSATASVSWPLAAGGLGGVGAVTLGAVALGRHFRRSLSEAPVSDEVEVAMTDGFAEADTSRAFKSHVAGAGIEPLQLLVDQALALIQSQGVPDVALVAARQGRSTVGLTFSCAVMDQQRMLQLGSEFGKRLGSSAQSIVNQDHDVSWHISGFKLAMLPGTPPDTLPSRPMLVPVGVLPSRQVLHPSWLEVGHLLLASQAGGGADTLLTALLSSLAARRRPEQMQLRIVAGTPGVPPGLTQFPHVSGRPIKPADEAALAALFEDLHVELARRTMAAADGAQSTDAETVLVIQELADLPNASQWLEQIGSQGRAYGMRIIAATDQPHRLDIDVLPHFSSRLVLQTVDGEQSVQLLGEPDAAELRPGEALFRLDGRAPVRMRGFRLAPEYLDELAGLMREAYSAAAAADLPPDADDSDPIAVLELDPMDGQSEPEKESVPPAEAELEGEAQPVGELSLDDEPEPEAATAPSPLKPLIEFFPEPAPQPLIRIEGFGTLRVTSRGRLLVPQSSTGAQYKSWELLAFLGSRPNGSATKERILDGLWPEQLPDKAEAALRQLKHRMRTTLEEQVPELHGDVLRSERDGTCALNAEVVTSDVQRFTELCRSIPRLNPAEVSRAYDELSQLYQGDLLTEPCYEWVHQREGMGVCLQERYRDEFERTTKYVARFHLDSGRPDLAVPLYKRLLLLEPTLEDIARELYRCYARLGDRTALLREHRHLEQALQQMATDSDEPASPELYEPEPQTLAAYEEALRMIESGAAEVGPSALKAG